MSPIIPSPNCVPFGRNLVRLPPRMLMIKRLIDALVVPFLFLFEVERNDSMTFSEIHQVSIRLGHLGFNHFNVLIANGQVLYMQRFEVRASFTLSFVLYFLQQVCHLVAYDTTSSHIRVDVQWACGIPHDSSEGIVQVYKAPTTGHASHPKTHHCLCRP